jgi:hypothetical protein
MLRTFQTTNFNILFADDFVYAGQQMQTKFIECVCTHKCEMRICIQIVKLYVELFYQIQFREELMQITSQKRRALLPGGFVYFLLLRRRQDDKNGQKPTRQKQKERGRDSGLFTCHTPFMCSCVGSCGGNVFVIFSLKLADLA